VKGGARRGEKGGAVWSGVEWSGGSGAKDWSRGSGAKEWREWYGRVEGKSGRQECRGRVTGIYDWD